MEILENELINIKESIIMLLPRLTIALIVFVLGYFIIRVINKKIFKKIADKSRDSVATRFLGDIISGVFFVLLFIFVLNILGFSGFTKTFLGAAGITTFIIGFALKDIGENFLAGIVMVFNRPFKMGDIIQIDNEMGRVIRISMRETTIKSLDGKDIYIPNGDILKKQVVNYTIDDLLQFDFNITVFNKNNIRSVIEIIQETISSFDEVLNYPPVVVNIIDFRDGMVYLQAIFWYNLNGSRTMNRLLRTRVMLSVFETLNEKGINIPDQVQDINLMKTEQ